jgi:hypothetical protein
MSDGNLKDELEAFVDFFNRQWVHWMEFACRLKEMRLELEKVTAERDAAHRKLALAAPYLIGVKLEDER